MPAGIPVATVAINGAKNAGILSASILSVSNREIAEKLTTFKETLTKTVQWKASELEKVGYEAYLTNME